MSTCTTDAAGAESLRQQVETLLTEQKMVMLDTIAATGSFDGPTVAKALQGLSYEGPTGKESIRAGDHQVIKDYYLLIGKASGDMADKDDLAKVLSAGQSFPAVEATGCTLG